MYMRCCDREKERNEENIRDREGRNEHLKHVCRGCWELLFSIAAKQPYRKIFSTIIYIDDLSIARPYTMGMIHKIK